MKKLTFLVCLILCGSTLFADELPETPPVEVNPPSSSSFSNWDSGPMMQGATDAEKMMAIIKNADPTYDNPTIPATKDKLSKFTPGLVRFPKDIFVPLPGMYKAFTGVNQDNTITLYTEKIAPRGGPVLNAHRHEGNEEFQIILEGSIFSTYGKKLEHQVLATAGDVLYYPPGVCHQAYNPSTSMSAKVIVMIIMSSPNAKRSLIPCAQSYEQPYKMKKTL